MPSSKKGGTLVVCVLLAAGAVSSCDEPLSDITGPTPDLTVSFASIRAEIFDQTDSSGRSGCVNCHNPRQSQFTGGLDLQTDPYAALVNVASRERPGVMRVAPGNPEASYLIHKVEGRSTIVGVRMPLNGPPYLTSGQISVIRRWIENGAPNN